MLPPPHRLRRSEDFDDVVRGGARSGTRRLVVHLLPDPDPSGAQPARAGVVVSKAVGSAVDRNLVKRRLRGLLAPRIATLGDGTRLVVRALPPSRGSASAELGADLDAALDAARRRARRRRERG